MRGLVWGWVCEWNRVWSGGVGYGCCGLGGWIRAVMEFRISSLIMVCWGICKKHASFFCLSFPFAIKSEW